MEQPAKDTGTGRIGRWLRKIPRSVRYIIPGILLFVIILLEFFSRSAALIFNRVMEDQDMLSGSITVEKIIASPLGHVAFEGLEWTDPEGRRILYIPDGEFTVDLLDALTQRFSSASLERLMLNHASLSIRLNDDMSFDFVRSPDAEPRPKEPDPLKKRREEKTEEELRAEGEEKRRIQRQRLEQDWTNFNHSGHPFDLDFFLKDCRLEVFYRERHYLLEAVRLSLDVDTKKAMVIKGSTGPFGGTMIGSGIFLDGTVDFTKTIPACDLSLLIDAVDPSSLGFGVNIHDPLSMSIRFQGDISHPVGRGTLYFDKLSIPALDFRNVDGDVYYEDALIRFTDVNALVYDGRLAAEGWYNLDTRHYHISGKGTELKTRKALPGSGLYCMVDLDLTFDSGGSVQTTTYEGSFLSGRGRYRWIPFQSLQGRFHNLARKLDFYDVVINFGGVTASTDALSIDDGKLTLHPIHITDKDGKPLVTYDPEAQALIDTREKP